MQQRHISALSSARATRLLAILTATGVVATLGFLGGSAVAAGGTEDVVVAADGTIPGWYDGGSGLADPWIVEQHLGVSSLHLSSPDNKNVTLMRNLSTATPPASGPATAVSQIADLFASGLGYTTDGHNANLQLSLRYKPAHPAVAGVDGAVSICGNKDDYPGGNAWEGWCWTILKYEPTVDSTGWSTKTLVNPLDSSDPGWWGNTTRTIGANIPANTWYKKDISFFTSEMSEVVIDGVGLSIGSAAGATGATIFDTWVKNLTWGGVSRTFSATPVMPATPPAGDSDDLEDLMASDPATYPNASSDFSANGGTPGAGLAAIDSAKPLDGELPWTNPSDNFVDVYAYSAPIHLGTFPVVNGQVILTGIDVSALEAGGHHLVFIGQTSTDVQVVAISVRALAATGAASALPVVLAATSLLLLGALLVLSTAYARRHEAW